MFGKKKKSNAINFGKSQFVAVGAVLEVFQVLFGTQDLWTKNFSFISNEPEFSTESERWHPITDVVFTFQVSAVGEIVEFIVRLTDHSHRGQRSFKECIVKHSKFQATAVKYHGAPNSSRQWGEVLFIDVEYHDGKKKYIAGTSWMDRIELSEEEYAVRPGDQRLGAYRSRQNR